VEAADFAHGSYGDYAGMAFYGPPADGFWLDRLAVSERFVHPLFCGILDRSSALGGDRAPSLVRDWNLGEGWVKADRSVEVLRRDAVVLLDALAGLTVADVAPYCSGCTPEECVQCASVIRQFVGQRLTRGLTVFVENE